MQGCEKIEHMGQFLSRDVGPLHESMFASVMSAHIAHKSSFLQGTHALLSSKIPRIACLSAKTLSPLRSARALTTMAASSYKYVVLGGGNSSG